MADAIPPRGHSRLTYFAATVGLGAVLIVSRFVDPADLPPALCLPDMIAGIPCLTTGLTRSFHSTANGQLADAARFHPLGPFFFLLTIVFFGLACLRLCGWKRPLPIPNEDRLLFGLLALLGVWWVVRLLELALQ